MERLPEFQQLPKELSGWRGEEIPPDKATAEVLAADVTTERVYTEGDGTQIGVFVAYFAQQQVNSQIHSPRNCLPGAGWKPISITERKFEMGGAPREATRMVVRRGEYQSEILYWFRTRGGDLAGEYALKWDLVKNSMARRPTDAAFIRYSAGYADSSALRNFMTLFEPHLDRVLGDVGL